MKKSDHIRKLLAEGYANPAEIKAELARKGVNVSDQLIWNVRHQQTNDITEQLLHDLRELVDREGYESVRKGMKLIMEK